MDEVINNTLQLLVMIDLHHNSSKAGKLGARGSDNVGECTSVNEPRACCRVGRRSTNVNLYVWVRRSIVSPVVPLLEVPSLDDDIQMRTRTLRTSELTLGLLKFCKPQKLLSGMLNSASARTKLKANLQN